MELADDSRTMPVSHAASPVPRGTLVGERFRVEEFLSEGGMGFVVRGFDLKLQEPVAIKFLKTVDGQESIQRFMREARAAAKVKNEHIIDILDVGAHEGMPYLVMELVDGEALGKVLETHGPLEATYAVDLLLQACDAMADAHARGIVHRDLKPNNLMLTRRGDGSPFVKVLDFGLATAPTESGRVAVGITATNAAFGSPAYMPPEQIRAARNADARSDIWALGVILYELLVDRLPFEGESIPAVLAAITADPPRPLVELRPELTALGTVLERCFQKDPDCRFQTVAELAGALAPFASAEGALIATRAARLRHGTTPPPRSAPPPPRLISPPASAVARSSTMAASADTSEARPARRWLIVPIVVSMVAAVSVIALLRRGAAPIRFVSPTEPPATTTPAAAAPAAAVSAPPRVPTTAVTTAAANVPASSTEPAASARPAARPAGSTVKSRPRATAPPASATLPVVNPGDPTKDLGEHRN